MSLSTWRYPLTIHPVQKSDITRDQGIAFRAIREACGLNLLEIAPPWGADAVTIAALEDGDMAFPTVLDFQAATSQLWLWRQEKAWAAR